MTIIKSIYYNNIGDSMDKYLEEYNSKKELLNKRIEVAKSNLEQAIKNYESIKTSDIDRKEKRLEIASHSIIRYSDLLKKLEIQVNLLRPKNPEDMLYRNRQYDEFSKKIGENLPDNIPLRFHGTSLCNVKNILSDGELSSSVDRLGFETSYDVSNQVSVTTKKSIDVTIKGYADLLDFDMPAGCIFVLLPKDEEDAKAGDSLLMRNVNFKNEPDRLYAIITTPENIEIVKEWCIASNIDQTKILDFDNFINKLNYENQNKKL